MAPSWGLTEEVGMCVTGQSPGNLVYTLGAWHCLFFVIVHIAQYSFNPLHLCSRSC